jgi:hypothetical protein
MSTNESFSDPDQEVNVDPLVEFSNLGYQKPPYLLQAAQQMTSDEPDSEVARLERILLL